MVGQEQRKDNVMIAQLPWILPTLGFVSLIGLQWKTHRDLSQDVERKVGRVYERIDEVKYANKKDFVSQPVCDVKYQGIQKKLDEISADVKLILQSDRK